ncbi:MAG: hypothetical protein ACLQGP_01385 [Isosphaeraceae bacterium]
MTLPLDVIKDIIGHFGGFGNPGFGKAKHQQETRRRASFLDFDFFTGFLNAEIRGKPPSASAGDGGKENGRLVYCQWGTDLPNDWLVEVSNEEGCIRRAAARDGFAQADAGPPDTIPLN